MDEVYRLQGRVIDSKGEAIPHLRLAVVDRDLISDDLIAIGRTDRDGKFRLSFTAKEFNQEPFEFETVPEIYIVFSTLIDGKWQAVHKQDFSHLKFKTRAENLGVIILDSWGDNPPVLKGVKATPGYKKDINRLNIDRDLVWYCLEFVQPIVEEASGWSNIKDGLDIYIGKDFSEPLANIFQDMKLGTTPEERANVNSFLKNSIHALYEPLTHTLYINEPRAKKINLDAFKVTIGHELVHVGQFQAIPELKDSYAVACRQFFELCREKNFVAQDMYFAFRQSEFHDIMLKLEAYSLFFQENFLQKRFPCSTFFDQMSLMDIILARVFDDVFKVVDSLSSSGGIRFEEWYRNQD